MTPAYSVIFFTVASGAGYGLLTWLAVSYLAGGWLPGGAADTAGRAALALGVLLVAAGLSSSTLHLGHPERAWRAFSQWRSSWLSREGVLAVMSFIPIAAFAGAWWLASMNAGFLRVAAAGTVVLALATVYCTAMIYASLKPIPRWSNPWVAPVYLGFSLASGGLLAVLLFAFGAPPSTAMLIGVALLLLSAWLIKLIYWRHIDRAARVTSMGSATGLGALGRVRSLEAPHTSANYVLKEMGFVIARKHARKLRRIALASGAVFPAATIGLAALSGGVMQTALLVLAGASGLFGLTLERWLFFAEAKHVVTVFYGEREV